MPERLGDMVLDGEPRGRHVERASPAEERSRVDIAEHQRGVGHRRLVPPRAVTGRSRDGAGAVGTDMQQRRRCRRQAMLPPPAPTLFTSTEGKPVKWPRKRQAEPGLARQRDAAGADQTDVVSGAAGVGDDDCPRRARLRAVIAGRRSAPATARS